MIYYQAFICGWWTSCGSRDLLFE